MELWVGEIAAAGVLLETSFKKACGEIDKKIAAVPLQRVLQRGSEKIDKKIAAVGLAVGR